MIRDNLKILLGFEPVDLPVISAYVDFTPELEGASSERPETEDPPPLRSWRRREQPRQREFRPGIVRMRDLLAEHEKSVPIRGDEHDSFCADRDRIMDYLNDEADTAAQGVAVFACSQAGLWHTIEIPVPVETQLFVDRAPVVNPLAQVMDTYDPFVLCIADSTSARIYTVRLGEPDSEELVKGPVINYKMTGGLSQRRIQERITNAVSAHMRDVAERVTEIVREEDIPWIMLGGDAIMLTEFRNHLPERMWDRVVEVANLDARLPVHEAVSSSMTAILEAEEQDSRRVEEQALAAAVSNREGAAGIEPVVAALRQGAVDTLVMDTNFNAEGWRCAADLTMIGDGGSPEGCPVGAGPAESTDLREAMVSLALRTGAYTEFVDGSDALCKAGGVAAILRWRPENLPESAIETSDLQEARS